MEKHRWHHPRWRGLANTLWATRRCLRTAAMWAVKHKESLCPVLWTEQFASGMESLGGSKAPTLMSGVYPFERLREISPTNTLLGNAHFSFSLEALQGGVPLGFHWEVYEKRGHGRLTVVWTKTCHTQPNQPYCHSKAQHTNHTVEILHEDSLFTFHSDTARYRLRSSPASKPMILPVLFHSPLFRS